MTATIKDLTLGIILGHREAGGTAQTSRGALASPMPGEDRDFMEKEVATSI
ncbi:hypothetical protein [Primorskyibacter sedentarius]|uniref:hypothetical protein n=1 Tax=Primorskyibacter sedentarius TaxID=745311 RepID=UPI003EB9EA06